VPRHPRSRSRTTHSRCSLALWARARKIAYHARVAKTAAHDSHGLRAATAIATTFFAPCAPDATRTLCRSPGHALVARDLREVHRLCSSNGVTPTKFFSTAWASPHPCRNRGPRQSDAGSPGETSGRGFPATYASHACRLVPDARHRRCSLSGEASEGALRTQNHSPRVSMLSTAFSTRRRAHRPLLIRGQSGLPPGSGRGQAKRAGKRQWRETENKT